MNKIVLRNIKNISTAGVTVATLLTIYGFKDGNELNLIHFSVAWACSVVSLRYFLRVSYTFNTLRIKCFKSKKNDFISTLITSHSLLIFLSCINTAVLNNMGIKLVIILFTLQSILIVFQWMLSYTTIFSKDFIDTLKNDSIKKKYRVSHYLTLFIDLGTMIISGYFIAITFTNASVEVYETLMLGILLFIVVVIEGATHWLTEKDWAMSLEKVQAP